jgi:hypothetical protein
MVWYVTALLVAVLFATYLRPTVSMLGGSSTATCSSLPCTVCLNPAGNGNCQTGAGHNTGTKCLGYTDHIWCGSVCTGTQFSADGSACVDWTHTSAPDCVGGAWSAGSASADSSCAPCTGTQFSADGSACVDWTHTSAPDCVGGAWSAGSASADSSCTLECGEMMASGTGVVVATGCTAGGVIRRDTCLLGCADGYTTHNQTVGSCRTTQADATVAEYRGQAVVCTPARCPAATLPTGQLVHNGCAAAGALGANCELRCADGYAESPVGKTAGNCLPDPGAPTASYRGQAVACVRARCPTASPAGTGVTVRMGWARRGWCCHYALHVRR